MKKEDQRKNKEKQTDLINYIIENIDLVIDNSLDNQIYAEFETEEVYIKIKSNNPIIIDKISQLINSGKFGKLGEFKSNEYYSEKEIEEIKGDNFEMV